MIWEGCRDFVAFLDMCQCCWNYFLRLPLQLCRTFTMAEGTGEKMMVSERPLAMVSSHKISVLYKKQGSPLHLLIFPMQCSLSPWDNSNRGIWSFSSSEHQIVALVLVLIAKGLQHWLVKLTAQSEQSNGLFTLGMSLQSQVQLQSGDGWVDAASLAM